MIKSILKISILLFSASAFSHILIAPLTLSNQPDSKHLEAGLNCPNGNCSIKQENILPTNNLFAVQGAPPKIDYVCPFASPLQVVKTSDYNMARRHPVLRIVRPHYGTDLVGVGAAPAQVRSISGGRVIRSEWNGGYGRQVTVLQDDGSVVTYSHLQLVNESYITNPLNPTNCALPEAGQRVEVNQSIGCMGMTGTVSGIHLHLEVYKSASDYDLKKRINPMLWKDFNQLCAGRFSTKRR